MSAPIKEWTRGVQVEAEARKQLEATASLPIVWPHLAVMPDVHWGIGSTVGSVVPTRGAIICACVGVDLGCGMMAERTSLRAEDVLGKADLVRAAIEAVIPHGRTHDGGPNDRGAWGDVPEYVGRQWQKLEADFRPLAAAVPKLDTGRQAQQLGTLGTGNHFVEVCTDEEGFVWVMLHSGSRGVGNRIGSTYIAAAKRRCEKDGIVLPNADLAWLPDDAPECRQYLQAVSWAQAYAKENRRIMMAYALSALSDVVSTMRATDDAIDCHHNYVARERHFGEDLWITRKGAVSAKLGELGIIPGAMGRKSFIVRGKGNPESFSTCSHGAGRTMSRMAAKKTITLEQHAADTAGLACRKDADVLDESPSAYKSIDDVMAAQADLVEVVHELRALVCVKG